MVAIILWCIGIVLGAIALVILVELYSRYEARKFDESLRPYYQLLHKRQVARETEQLRAHYYAPPYSSSYWPKTGRHSRRASQLEKESQESHAS